VAEGTGEPVDGAAAGGEQDPWPAQLTALGSFIRMQRQLADLSLREMANLTKLSNAYLSQVERGLHQPSLKVLRSIAEALGIPPEQLLGRAGFMGQTWPGGWGAAADTEAAIKADPRLSDVQKQALLGVYRGFLGAER
jgi:transcriptional regulator with XRE-family HTH domain